MKALRGRASAPVVASAERCLALFAEIDHYPGWYPEVVRQVEVIDRDGDGLATRAGASLHVSYGPLATDLGLTLAVEVEQATVRLVRLANEPSDPERFIVSWSVTPRATGGGAGGECEITLELDALLDVPRLLPLGGIGETMARGFLAAAKRELELGAASA